VSPRVPLVAGNWKMNTTVSEGVELAAQILALDRPPGVDVAVLPPFPHLWPLHDLLKGSGIALGAQDCFWERAGAYTGEVSPRMLAELCDHVLVGHSERRHILGETDERTAKKLAAALAEGLKVILAVGELLDERRAGRAESVVTRQLDAALRPIDAGLAARIVIAYEPVWAIGTGETASPDDAQAMCAGIRSHVAVVWSTDVAGGMRILYGGSVSADNAASLFAQADVDGGLVGGASLKVDQFAGIIVAAAAAAGGGGG
jgi:triosephosphate isomerase